MARKKPFSGKAKKKQLLEKRELKRNGKKTTNATDGREEEQKPVVTTTNKKDLKTIFAVEAPELISERKKDATRFLEYKTNASPYARGLGQPCMELSMPERPRWTHAMTNETLEAEEEKSFHTWIEEIRTNHTPTELNYFEQNIQVWRQLWRVIEKSDVILLVVDARFPVIHFSSTLYRYITRRHRKAMVLCINKTDLISLGRLKKWECFFRLFFPQVRVCAVSQESNTDALHQAIAACTVIKNGQSTSASPFVYGTLPPDHDAKVDRDKHIVIGMVGDPNMGKSTLINRLFGKKVVSESATPGHTKHFQTMFLTPTLCFCDCPGVVFPKLHIGREIQVLFGSYPISQIREPYSAVRYLAEHCSPGLPEIYKLTPIDDYGDDITDLESVANYHWSPYRIVEAFAKKKRFFIRGGRFDVFRAGNQILRDALHSEKVVLSFDPPTAEEYKAVEMSLEPSRCVAQAQNDGLKEEEYDGGALCSGSSSEEERGVGGNFQLLQIDEEDSSDSD